VNVTDAADWSRAMAEVFKAHNRIDVLVQAAGAKDTIAEHNHIWPLF
jgi:NADP-dependent 3-hydroxy acid dehydrogenase YdfG